MRTAVSNFDDDDKSRGRLTRVQRERLRQDEFEQSRETKKIKQEVRLARELSLGTTALAAHVMEVLTDLDDYRQSLAGNDQLKNILLGDIEAQAVRQFKAIQRGLYSEWGM